VSLLDKAVRGLALRWARGKVDKARKGGSAVLRFLDGQKRLIVVLGFIVSGFVALLTGQDVSQWLDLGLRALGWTSVSDVALVEGGKGLAARIVPLLFAIWASAHALWKMWRQHKAGASLAELGSTTAAVKQARAEGIIP